MTFFLSPIFIVCTASSTSVRVFSLSPTVNVVATLFIFTDTLSQTFGGVVRAASPLTVVPGAGGVVVVGGGVVVVVLGGVVVVPAPITVISATMREVSIFPKLSSIFASIVYLPDSLKEYVYFIPVQRLSPISGALNNWIYQLTLFTDHSSVFGATEKVYLSFSTGSCLTTMAEFVIFLLAASVFSSGAALCHVGVVIVLSLYSPVAYFILCASQSTSFLLIIVFGPRHCVEGMILSVTAPSMTSICHCGMLGGYEPRVTFFA